MYTECILYYRHLLSALLRLPGCHNTLICGGNDVVSPSYHYWRISGRYHYFFQFTQPLTETVLQHPVPSHSIDSQLDWDQSNGLLKSYLPVLLLELLCDDTSSVTESITVFEIVIFIWIHQVHEEFLHIDPYFLDVLLLKRFKIISSGIKCPSSCIRDLNPISTE